ncbi:dihydrolipoamide acetyltransferase family protein [Pseudonocardia sp. GCM10023141]|uniref:dihydrolipoamide acetyltransferase family protein n=1 Tax=Pseudonocardia sp. GCM10023141 TaxID=3252653 RepID=UPI003618719A
MPDISMPRLSDTMEEGIIATWRKQVGDPVAAGDVLVEVETDKAIMELEAYDDGVLDAILVGEGERVPIGTPIGVIGDGSGGAVGSAASPDVPAAAPEPVPTTVASTTVAVVEPAPAGAPAPATRPPASPLARRIARERGVDLATVTGSGPNGRIIRVDIESAQPSASPDPVPAAAPPVPPVPAPPVPVAPPSSDGDFVAVPLTGMQRVAAARLTQSKRDAPHFYLTSAVDVTDLVAFRATLNADLAASDGPRVSMNDLVVKAVATALRVEPAVNVSFAGDAVHHHRKVNVGVAVAVPGGLLVPVVHDADRKSLSRIATESRELSGRARAGKLRPDEMSGGTFTVSNLGMFGVEQFAAVINPPEAAILAVGAATEEVRPRDGELVVRSILRITLSCDHRAVDGATGAGFLKALTGLLEHPLRIVV